MPGFGGGGGGGGGGGYPKRVTCPLTATFETKEDEEGELMTISGGHIKRTQPDIWFPGQVDIAGVTLPVSEWYIQASISANGSPDGIAIIVAGVFPGLISMVPGEQVFANYPGTGKGCGNLTFVQGFYGGMLVWYITI